MLILTIVYSTNFFKDFFFEAVVTVNLTALLVLTTLFISVSQSLPPTAYVKMIDVWLIFTQMIPFMEVLLHTWMDSHRVSEDREINHHGKTLAVGDVDDEQVMYNDNYMEYFAAFYNKQKQKQSPRTQIIQVQPPVDVQNSALVSRDEKVLVDARKNFYQTAKEQENEWHAKCLKFGETLGETFEYMQVLLNILYTQICEFCQVSIYL